MGFRLKLMQNYAKIHSNEYSFTLMDSEPFHRHFHDRSEFIFISLIISSHLELKRNKNVFIDFITKSNKTNSNHMKFYGLNVYRINITASMNPITR